MNDDHGSECLPVRPGKAEGVLGSGIGALEPGVATRRGAEARPRRKTAIGVGGRCPI